MDSSSKHSFKTSIHLNITDLNSSGQSSTVSDCNESDDDDSKLLQFKRVFKHLEDLENNLSELNKYKKNKKPQQKKKSQEDKDELAEEVENLKPESTIKMMYLNEKPSINERYYETLNTKTNELINEETSSKLLMSHMPSPMYKDTLNQYTSTSNFSSAMSSNLYENYDRYARPTENTRSPFFYGLSQTSPPSKRYAERPYDTHKQEEGKQLKNEVNRLKTELEDLKLYNSRFYAKTTTLEQKIEDITNTISRKKAETDLINGLLTKTTTIKDYEFTEKDKVLSDLCQSKLLLEKTSHLTNNNSCIINHRLSPSYQQISHIGNNSLSYGTQSNSSNMSINMYNNQSRNLPSSFNNTNRVSSLNGVDPIKNGVQIDNCPLKKEIDQLKVDLTRAQSENIELKNKMWQCQNKKIQEPGISIPIVSVNSAKQSDSQLQANAKSTPNLLNEVLLDNQACSKLSREQAVIHKQTLQSTIQDLRNQNQNLKIRLDKLLGSNTKGLEKLKHYYNENNKLKTELKLLSTRKLNETSESAKSQYELKTEINNLNNKLKFEQAQRDELKRRYETEISSVKIRYDNELEKQNKLMQLKNDNLVKEINKLNESIRKLQEEKSALLMKMKSDVLESTELKSSMSTTSASKSYPSSFHDCSQSSKRTGISEISINLSSPRATSNDHHRYTYDLSNQIPLKSREHRTICPQNSISTTYEFTFLSPLILD